MVVWTTLDENHHFTQMWEEVLTFLLQERSGWFGLLDISILIAGFTLVLAPVLMRMLLCKSNKVSKRGIYEQRDEQKEQRAYESNQLYAEGSVVWTTSPSSSPELATIQHFDSATKRYDLLIANPKGEPKVRKNVSAQDAIQPIEVAELHIYPIKSCRGISVDRAVIRDRGLAGDREWMFVDSKGTFLSQRKYSRMALIAPKLDDFDHPTVLTLCAPGMPDLPVPILDSAEEASRVQVRVWKSRFEAVDQGSKASKWINSFLEQERGQESFRLVYFGSISKRPCNEKYAAGHQTGFADGFSFLVTLNSSLDQLNEWLKEKVPMNRFRPNIVLKGAPPFVDETWNVFAIDAIRFRNVRPCARCQLPSVDQITGIRHAETQPLNTLKNKRNGQLLGFENGKSCEGYFGTNAVVEHLEDHLDSPLLKLGDRVRILTLKDVVYA